MFGSDDEIVQNSCYEFGFFTAAKLALVEIKSHRLEQQQQQQQWQKIESM